MKLRSRTDTERRDDQSGLHSARELRTCMGEVKMDLDTALDDLDGLFEAFRALADDTRKSALRRNADA